MIEWFHAAAFPFLPYAYPIELLQILMSCVGLPMSIVGVREAWLDLDVVRRNGVNGTRLYTAKRNIFEEWARLAMHLALFINGCILITYPPPEPGLVLTVDRLFQLLVTRLTTTFVIAVLTYKSYRDLSDRRQIRTMMRANANRTRVD